MQLPFRFAALFATLLAPLLAPLFAALAVLGARPAHAANFCGELSNAFGPYDYRKRAELPAQIEIVEHNHYTPEVANGIKGISSYIGGDLDYTLRAFPNHVPALGTMARVAQRDHTLVVPGAHYPVECYFDRAIRFAPDDGAARASYGTFLFGRGEHARALAMLEEAVRLDPQDPTIHYNLGLLQLKAKQYEQANLHAQLAYQRNFPLPGLKNKLIEAGKWDESKRPALPAAPAPAPEADGAPKAAAPAAAPPAAAKAD